MNNKIAPGLLGIGLAALLATGAQAEGDPVAGQWKANTCLGCHGVPTYKNVYPTYYVPKLGGQNAAYIASALKAYRDGSRVHSTMHANAANLSDEDIADIAAFLSGGVEQTASK